MGAATYEADSVPMISKPSFVADAGGLMFDPTTVRRLSKSQGVGWKMPPSLRQ
jgi:hypothetical protein